MIIVKVGEPTTKNIGDVWFDPTTRVTQRAEVVNSVSPPGIVIAWIPISPSSSLVFHPNKGDIFVDHITKIPSLWDGTSWISAVPLNYNYPPINPTDGMTWTDSLTQISYIFFQGQWCGVPTSAGAQGFVSGAGWPTNVSSQSPSPNLVPTGQAVNVPTTPVQNTLTTYPSGTSNGNTITIIGPNRVELVTIHTDTGTLTYGPTYKPDLAAEIFWQALLGSCPTILQAQIVSLTKDVKDATARLAVAEDRIIQFNNAGYTLPEPPPPFNANDSWERAMGIIK